MFRDEDELNCVINILSLQLEGKNRDELIYFLIGESASNGKSTLLEINKDTLGNFAYRFPTNIITGKRESSESGNPAIRNFKYKRMAYCSEPDANAKININVVKELTGDIICVRGLYSNEQEQFRCQSNMFVLCQTAPILEKVDEGIKRRIITIPFTIKFVDNPMNDYEEKKVNFTSEEKENLKYSFLDLLTTAYINLHNNNYKFDIPESFREFKNDYIEDCNTADNIILENFEYCKGFMLKSSDVIFILKDYSLTPSEIKTKMKRLLNIDNKRRGDGMYCMNAKLRND